MKLGERESLGKIYIQWGVILLALCVIAGLGTAHYYQDVSPLSPEQLIQMRPEGSVRVIGRVKVGTLKEGAEDSSFELTGATGGLTSIRVEYHGKPYENMREMKILVIEGDWNTGGMQLSAKNFRPLPNTGFVVAAYLLALIPLAIFVFHMERSVILLSLLIKEEKGYQPPGVTQET